MKILLTAMILIVGMSTQVLAQSNCGPRKAMAETLETSYGEKLDWVGSQEIHINGFAVKAVLEMYVNKKKGTFSMMLTRPDKIMCMMFLGTDYTEVNVKN